jgi:etoposide-induced 2.4 mRNA
LATIETKWGYFFGFGIPLASTTLIESITGGCLFAVLFPMSILAAHLAISPDQTTIFRLRFIPNFFFEYEW